MEQTNNLGKVIRIISEKAIIIDVGSDYLSINKGIDKESICNHIKNNFREILL